MKKRSTKIPILSFRGYNSFTGKWENPKLVYDLHKNQGAPARTSYDRGTIEIDTSYNLLQGSSFYAYELQNASSCIRMRNLLQKARDGKSSKTEYIETFLLTESEAKITAIQFEVEMGIKSYSREAPELTSLIRKYSKRYLEDDGLIVDEKVNLDDPSNKVKKRNELLLLIKKHALQKAMSNTRFMRFYESQWDRNYGY